MKKSKRLDVAYSFFVFEEIKARVVQMTLA